MSAPKHTPGPWAWQQMGDWKLIGQYGIRPIILDAIGPRLRSGPPARASLRVRNAERDLMVEFDSRHPDARLIAAAPELLEALRDLAGEAENYVRNDLGEVRDGLAHLIRDARELIAKAEGSGESAPNQETKA